MLSRVADSIYWMNRYIERAENNARFVDVNLLLTLDLPAEFGEQWEPLVSTTGDRAMFEEHFGEYTRENVIQFLSFDPDNPNSILACLHQARENARSIREIISSEMWEQVNRAYLMVRQAAFGERDYAQVPHAFFTQVKLASHLFAGVMDATMSHGEAWQFGRLGRHLERADKTSRILDVKYFILLPDVTYVGTPFDNIQWSALLRSASALEMYRKRFGRIDPVRVVEFLVLDREFPRAIRFCLAEAEDALHAITGSPRATFQNPAEQRLGRLRAEFDYTGIDEIVAGGVHEYLDAFQARLNRVGEAVFDTFFALHAEPVMSQQQGATTR
jgi:uncharacterized alpha-E superfamily protein